MGRNREPIRAGDSAEFGPVREHVLRTASQPIATRRSPTVRRISITIEWALLLAAVVSIHLHAQSPEPAAPHTVLFPIVSSCIANPDFAPQCAFANANAGYAILKDRRGESQLLLVATHRRWGMEDPNIEKRDEPNYFEEAWDARRCVATPNGSPAPDSEISLAINSKFGRSDGQLHIHIDLLKPGIADELHERFPQVHSSHPGATGRERDVLTFSGHPYSIAHYETLHGHNLFADLQKHLAPGDEMANHTIVVISDPAGGFFVLTDRAHGLDRASGEELQIDHHNLDPQRFLQLSNQAKSCLAGTQPQ